MEGLWPSNPIPPITDMALGILIDEVKGEISPVAVTKECPEMGLKNLKRTWQEQLLKND